MGVLWGRMGGRLVRASPGCLVWARAGTPTPAIPASPATPATPVTPAGLVSLVFRVFRVVLVSLVTRVGRVGRVVVMGLFGPHRVRMPR
ncbi:hypothetical protein [Tessaracoccus sp. OH4464_COT-324]|uniref:hypothetical protein n=1 Tax=Tessaracoccus sp. OH4464_COT-324 TaxID=2491059 RepID=UPI001319C7EF|nr:hypothetical protein [Tessaracoccus sp. OH4464_COT-324]